VITNVPGGIHEDQDHHRGQFRRHHPAKKLLARLRLGKGDALYATELADGIKLSPYDPKLAGQWRSRSASCARKRIERVLVPGFEPNAGTVAALMGSEAARAAGREAPGRERADPIFSRPCESGLAPPQPPKKEPELPRRRECQVAALLGGLKREQRAA
jgi:hypothetical protein